MSVAEPAAEREESCSGAAFADCSPASWGGLLAIFTISPAKKLVWLKNVIFNDSRSVGNYGGLSNEEQL